MSPLLQVRGLCKSFPGRGRLLGASRAPVRAVVDVDLDIARGETLALVGESGSGKSTTGLCILRLVEPDAGEIVFDGHDLTALTQAKLRPLRPRLQAVFQDPRGSLNPRMTVRELVGEALLVHGLCSPSDLDERLAVVLQEVGLPADAMAQRPHAFSGGQRQRIAIARALALGPDLVVCDEPTSALDVSVQAQVLDLMRQLQQQHGLAYLFISHDLGVVRHIAHNVAVMKAGRIVENGPVRAVFEDPQHPYTRALLAAVPRVRSGVRQNG